MRVFISYSTADINLVGWIANQLRCHAQVDFWDDSKVLGEPAWPTIYGWIDQCDLVIAIITDNTVRRAMSVGNEIGYAVKANKTIIPLITQNVPDSSLGCLGGITYARVTPNNFSDVLRQVEWAVLERKQQIQNRNFLFIVGGIVAILLAGSSDD